MLTALLEHFGYLAIFALLVAGGLAVPIPEEAVQLVAGVLAHEGYLRLRIAIPVAWAGIVTGDLLWFTLARRHGPALLSRASVARVLTPSRRAWLDTHFARHPMITVALSRHLSGLRLPAYALAATHGVRPAIFALADGLSALVSVPLVVTVGYVSWDHLAAAKADVRRVELGILLAVAVVAAIVVLVRRRRRSRGR
ncbi:DedA family protein [Anaeromyxobacter oryzisoli]|uniref:DedA family protein n=1 Tax=Anaeromyxobacter oryzisoli TaxID=2925408 RepID=UPI001F58861B|nr:DedA family protein [Anaeromyxobacter sp. SG63]